jgi:hypothetical protein
MNTIQIGEMKELIQKLNEIPSHYIFRGHSNEQWKLLSTIERMYIGQSADVIRRAEDYSILEFKSKFHLYDNENRTPTTKLEWLSLMQHYGAPTRLLDFTTSPYVALYFAIETMLPQQEEDPCVYALDYRALIKTSIEALRTIDRDFNKSYEQVLKNQDEVFEAVVDRFSSDILWATEPSRVNLRLDRQAGCFLFSGRPGMTIETLLSSDRYGKVDYTKIVMDRTLYESIYALLTKTNINSKVIYGDLSGLGRSIRMTLYAYK